MVWFIPLPAALGVGRPRARAATVHSVRVAETWMLDQGVKNLDAMTETHCAGLRV